MNRARWALATTAIVALGASCGGDDQSAEAAAAQRFLSASFEQDYDTVWELIHPDLRATTDRASWGGCVAADIGAVPDGVSVRFDINTEYDGDPGETIIEGTVRLSGGGETAQLPLQLVFVDGYLVETSQDANQCIPVTWDELHGEAG